MDTTATDYYCSSSHDYVWSSWNTATITSSATTTDTWRTWCGTSTSATSDSIYASDCTITWSNWNKQHYTIAEERVLTQEEREAEELAVAEQREARWQQDLENQAKWEKLEEEKAAAEKVAKELLEIFIGKDQMKVYEETGRVFVKGKDCDYHIIRGSGYNIRKIEKDRVKDLCVHLKDRNSMPETDNVIALLLHLKADEKKILELANDHGDSRDTPRHNLPLAACANG